MFREKSLSLIYIVFNTFPNTTDVHIFITAEAASLFKTSIFYILGFSWIFPTFMFFIWLLLLHWLCSFTASFKMTVGVLTTCHTKYTWDSSIFYFLLNRTTLQVFVTHITGALYVNPLWFYKHQHDNRVRSKLFWFVPSVPGYLREQEEHKPDPWRNPIQRNHMGLHLENEVYCVWQAVKTPTIIFNNPVFNVFPWFWTKLRRWKYVGTDINKWKIKNWKKVQETELTASSPLWRRRSALDYGAIQEEEEDFHSFDTQQIVTVSRQLLQNVYNVNCTVQLSVFLSGGALRGLGITCTSQKV
jgi:hypothetical protein